MNEFNFKTNDSHKKETSHTNEHNKNNSNISQFENIGHANDRAPDAVGTADDNASLLSDIDIDDALLVEVNASSLAGTLADSDAAGDATEAVNYTLEALGWDESWDAAWRAWEESVPEAVHRRYGEAWVPARVAQSHKRLYRVIGAGGEWLAEPSGQARASMLTPADWPAVGDWVAVVPRPADGRAVLVGVLPRRTRFARKVAGSRSDAQVVAANANTALLVTSMTSDFEPRRLERYAALAYDSGTMPAVVLTKADAVADAAEESAFVAQAMQAVPGADVFTVSAQNGTGMDRLLAYLAPGSTVVLVGSSGVGKSTLANALTGSTRMATQAVREDDNRGRHTTTHRELMALPNGAWLIDTPGMREVGLTTGTDEESGLGISHTFQDVESFAEQCRYRDCRHEREPGCAILAAIETGELESNRLQAYRKLQRELAYADRREKEQAKRVMNEAAKKLSKYAKSAQRSNPKR
ncbi:ribosome small subunit-dependent GTPase A [Paenibacillus agilis]|uniref:ribosome small subunit-dependent GTPase A n=1 Tax=Paenibacillus agilis TaxID=3020863 RepID=UPI0021BDD3A9|nr:ribosome small subunit-dependent GTPase A [Paenibacillus agilis]